MAGNQLAENYIRLHLFASELCWSIYLCIRVVVRISGKDGFLEFITFHFVEIIFLWNIMLRPMVSCLSCLIGYSDA